MAATKKLTAKKGAATKSTKDYVFRDTYQEVTDAVIKALEEGTVIWKCPWNQVGLPQNIITQKEYRGWNVFALNFHCRLNGYSSPYYITYKQAQQLGGTIKKGEKGIRITYWAAIAVKEKDQPKDTVETECRKRLVPKDYIVFNIDQTEGLEFPELSQERRSDAEKIHACGRVIDEMENKPLIRYNGYDAHYNRLTDTVVVPSLEKSTSNEEYYSTLFHEIAHSTGHETRLNRKELVKTDGHGNQNYAKEELTAELTATFLCAITGIEQATLANSAAYIANWLTALKNDKTLVLKAAAQAQKAADYILNKRYEPAPIS